MRRIQDLRKELKLKKTDSAKAVLVMDKETQDMIKDFINDMENRTGTKISVRTGDKPSEKANVSVKIREKEVHVGLSPL